MPHPNPLTGPEPPEFLSPAPCPETKEGKEAIPAFAQLHLARFWNFPHSSSQRRLADTARTCSPPKGPGPPLSEDRDSCRPQRNQPALWCHQHGPARSPGGCHSVCPDKGQAPREPERAECSAPQLRPLRRSGPLGASAGAKVPAGTKGRAGAAGRPRLGSCRASPIPGPGSAPRPRAGPAQAQGSDSARHPGRPLTELGRTGLIRAEAAAARPEPPK